MTRAQRGDEDPVDDGLREAIDAVFGGEATTEPIDGALQREVESLRDVAREALVARAHEGGSSAASEAMRAERVARRVLARTTREDLGRRGDAGLILEFVTQRLRDSALLRVAAAILIVQVTLVPLVAWHLLRTPELDGFRTGIEPTPPSFDDEAPAAEELAEIVGGSAWASGLDPLDLLRFDESLAEADAALRGLAERLEQDGVPEPTTAIGRDLWTLGLADAADPGADAAERRAAKSFAGSLAGSLVGLEAQLFRVQRGGAYGTLPEALEALAQQSAGGEPGARDLTLATRALAHARRLEIAVPDGFGAGDLSRALEMPASQWLAAVADLLESAAAGHDAYTRAWIDAVRAL